ncbi:MAG: alkaline phosphatase [Chloroflexota bacterium]
MHRSKSKTGLFLLVSLLLLLAACAAPTAEVIEKQVVVEKPVVQTVVVEKQVPVEVEKKVVETVVVEKQVVVEKEVVKDAPTSTPAKAKYLFIFVGDGLGVAQRNAAELYLAATAGAGARPEDTDLLMNTFPAQGMNTTYDLSSVIPDSASTATAIATGFKTKSGVIGMDAAGTVSYESITEVAKAHGWKVGVISTVSLDHATPAAFYAHVPTRKNMYDISMQLANSDFDYFAGGQLLQHKSKEEGKPDAIEAARANGFTVVTSRADLEALEPGVGKVLAMNDMVDGDAAMYYTVDQPEGYITLTEYVAKGIELLDNPTGFVMVVEAGKIDWACHANDAGASIHDTLAFDEAIAEAYRFYQQHPDETLIVVTGDHETGGMTIGFAGTGYSSFFDKIQHQNMSYIGFDDKLAEYKASHTAADAKLEDLLPVIEEAFGLYVIPAEEKATLEKAIADGKAEGASDEAKKAAAAARATLTQSMALTDLELAVLEEAFQNTMLGKEERASDQYTYLLYGGYEPLTVKLTTILNQKSGIAWTSYSHTGVPVQTSAIGPGSELFNGYYDQTDIHSSMMLAAGFITQVARSQ